MKKTNKIISIFISALITFSAFAFGGCEKKTVLPDYSDSTSNINLYAFYGPSDGRKSGGGIMGDGTDQRTIERYREYKDAGFNILLIENEAPYKGQEWSTSDTKKVMDMCFEVGLDVIVHDTRLWQMATSKKTLIGQTFNGIKIKTQSDMNEIVGEYMKDYNKHPAFYGIYVMDEPTEEQMPNCLMIVKAIKAVNPSAFIHLCLTTGRAGDFMEEYSEEGWTDLVYDNYHALYQREDSRSGGYVEGLDKKIVGDNYIRGLEFAANLSREKGLNFSAVTFQTFGGGVDSYNGNAKYGWRPIDEYDMRYGVYVSLAYVPDYLVWFHYWPSRYTASVISPVSSWMDEWGNKVWYDEGKKLNEEILKYGKVLSNFEFQGVHYYTDARRLPYYYRVDNLYEVKDVNVESINGEMILSELYDAKKGVTGYFITNSKAPYERKGLNATVEFSGKNHAVVYKNGDPEVVTLKNGKLDVDLGCADGILVLPYQI